MAKPKLALLPAAQGSKFYSVLPSSGVGDFNFTRSGSATRINSQGLIETVGSGVSRLNYPLIDGVVKGCPHHILEPVRRNLFKNSITFSDWSNSQSSEVLNSIISPDGTLNATKLIPNTSTSAWSGLNSPNDTPIISGTDYSFSLFAKKGEYKYIQVGGSTPYFNGSFSTINLDDGVVEYESGINSNVENYGNGWYRISFTQTALQSGSGLSGFIAVYSYPSNSRLQSFGGDGVSGIYVWGVQFEDGLSGVDANYPTSFINTSGTIVTRSAETANGSGDAATFNDSEGVLMAEISGFVDTDDYRMISLNAGSSSNTLFIGLRNDTGNVYFYLISGTNQANYISDVNATNTNIKLAVKYKENDVSFYVNGIKLYSTNSATMISGLNQLEFGYGNGNPGSYPFYGNTKQIQYYDTALTDSELEQLTSWVSFEDMAISQQYSLY